MKYFSGLILSFFISLIAFSPLFSQAQSGKLSVGAAYMLSKHRPHYEEWVIVLQEQADLIALVQSMDNKQVPAKERPLIVMRELKSIASLTQSTIQNRIQGYKSLNPSQTIDQTSYWLVNMMVLKCEAGLILELLKEPAVQRIELVNERFSMPVKPLKGEAKVVNPGQAEPGLVVVGARDMWKRGYTGKGRICYNMDTGVWSEHPSFKNRFLANFYPLSHAWLGFDFPVPADKSGSHGTHTLGTQLGLDTATNDTIGLAFDAYWIASDPVATSMATVKPLTTFVDAFQWAFNPDGDTNTNWDIPDVINNSWGFGVATDDSLCNSFVSQTLLAVEAAGIACVFSAGNDGPGASTVGIPNHINTTEVNTFAVGSVNPLVSGYPISSFSSRGPTICGGTGSLVIKPEVVAPGENIRSAILKDQYDYYQGTSMAAPHVSGAVLLLKQAFPNLTGHDILNALYVTAIDLGPLGEENDYGRGIIHLDSAFNYLSNIATPVIPSKPAYDLAIQSISDPDGPFVCQSPINPVVTIQNLGDSTLDSLNFIYWLSGNTALTYDWNGTLTPGQKQTISLPSMAVPPAGPIEAFVTVYPDSSILEENFINNRRAIRTIVRPQLNIPFFEGFESGMDSINWQFENPDFDESWELVNTGGIDYSFNSIMLPYMNGVKPNTRDYMVSPVFDISNSDSLFLDFKVAYQHLHPNLTDSLVVQVSTDCGTSWNEVYRKGGSALSTHDTLSQQFTPTQPWHWRQEHINLTPYCSEQELIFRFYGYCRRGNYITLDNISLYTDSNPADIQENAEYNVFVYPNPATDVLHIECKGNTEKLNVRIVNETGKTVLRTAKQKASQGKVSISLPELSSGIYYVVIRSRSNEWSSMFFIQ